MASATSAGQPNKVQLQSYDILSPQKDRLDEFKTLLKLYRPS
jgi:hypothetical protein